MNILLMCNTIARTLTDKGGRDKQNKWTQWFDHLSTLILTSQHHRAMIVLPTPFKIIRPDVAKILPLKKTSAPCKNNIFLSFLTEGPLFSAISVVKIGEKYNLSL
jgi:hypothetical protein